jgi:NADP-dependent 3-hydroxy acid dehydrogenase YdfG
MSDFTSKTVVITGASRGIGAATARHFASLGANVVLAARTADDINAIATEIGQNALAVTCDVSDASQVETLMNTTLEHFDSIDVLVNNAGIIDPVERLSESNIDAWDRLIDINVKGVYYAIRYALPIMKTQGAGTILNIGSGAATSALEGWSHYCTSKAAVHHLNACLHKEESENGIRAITLSPGTVATEMQTIIAASGINPVSQIPWDDHIPAEWAARTLGWMATTDANDWLGQVVSLREAGIRARVGLI